MVHVLMNLLPGLRDIRTPLTVGFIYIFTGWLIFGENIPSANEARGVWKSIFDLYAFTGKPAAFATLSFMAYVIGTLVITIGRNLGSIARMPFTAPTLRLECNEMARADLGSYVLARLNEVPYGVIRYESFRGGRSDPKVRMAALMAMNGVPSAERKLVTKIEQRLAYEQEQLRVKLLIASPEIYTEHDRHSAEAEFRTALSAASCTLFLCLAFSASFWWLPALAISVACYYTGKGKRREANDVLVQCVVAGELAQPAIDETLEQFRMAYDWPSKEYGQSAEPATD